MSDTHAPIETEVLVVGGGPGGYATAIRAGTLDADVTLVSDLIGGTCLNHGCIPSKALISTTERIHDVTTAEEMGIYGDPYVDIKELVTWKDSIVTDLTQGVTQLCRANGVDVVEGRAVFEDETTAVVDGENGQREISFEKAVIATGSAPIDLPNIDSDHPSVMMSHEALSPSSIPERLVVLGGGYIGMELAFVYARLGTSVTVIEMADDVLPQFESAISKVVAQRAREHGIDIQTSERAVGLDERSDGQIIQTETDDGQEQEYRTESVLVAVGRQPVTDTVGIESLDIDLDEDGFIEVDSNNRTSLEHIFAVGDCSGEPMLAHKAHHEGMSVAGTITGSSEDGIDGCIPAVVFTDPEIGVVGSTADDLESAGVQPLIGQFSFDASGRALTEGDATGFVRIVGNAETGAVRGGQIVGNTASDLIAEIALAIDYELTLSDIANTVHAHPTFSEAVMEAAAGALGKSIHGGTSK